MGSVWIHDRYAVRRSEWNGEYVVTFATGLYQVRDEKFEHKGFFIEWVSLLIHEEDVQAITATTGATGERFHGNGDFGGKARGRNMYGCLLYDIGIVLIEGRAYLNVDKAALD